MTSVHYLTLWCATQTPRALQWFQWVNVTGRICGCLQMPCGTHCEWNRNHLTLKNCSWWRDVVYLSDRHGSLCQRGCCATSVRNSTCTPHSRTFHSCTDTCHCPRESPPPCCTCNMWSVPGLEPFVGCVSVFLFGGYFHILLTVIGIYVWYLQIRIHLVHFD